MNQRQRFLEGLLLGRAGRLPLFPGAPRESTLGAWREQGLPDSVHYYLALLETLGIQEVLASSQALLGVSFQMIPTFQERILDHGDGHYPVRDWTGAITEIPGRYDYTHIRMARDLVTGK